MEKRSLQEIGALYHSDPIKHKKKVQNLSTDFAPKTDKRYSH
ncbi:hypothetical protein IC1_05846 [Bacillus cereus VD022]|uniref:Uncharacterized protein n=1 Tax=Bacillus cereus TIAC219 TaxID=718222 RepID=A0ABC9SS37_BACCE|nr:hypothetical protein IC1_05846 [Bacillus cereus VD022]EOQ58694.1 hypothetical protein IAY_06023 [Bacillus cereus TIAC219]SPT76240.1 Uncharacterised protein [Bacillus cereus]